MIKKLAFALMSLTATAAMADTFNGNGATGFGGSIGLGSLDVTLSGSTLNFTLNAASPLGNDTVIYFDTIGGGFTDTSTLGDHADGGRTAISGTDGTNRSLLTFAPGFAADFALSVEPTFAGLFQLNAGGNGTLTFVQDAMIMNPSGNTYTFSLNLASLGISPGDQVKFVASLISTTGYRSNETIGTSNTIPGTPGDAPNAGFNGTQTFSDFNTFQTAAIPEPATVLLVGPALLGGMFFVRRRRA